MTAAFGVYTDLIIEVLIGTGILGLFYLGFFPIYGVWSAHKSGEADLARAKNEQLIQIAEADGRLRAAEKNKEAAIIEASAVAAQIQAIGANLQKHDLYLRWQWIKMMEDMEVKTSTVYVPTEANLPILEAGRRRE